MRQKPEVKKLIVRFHYFVLALLLGMSGSAANAAAKRFIGFNNTTATDLTGVFLAPAGTTQWGPNEVLNDKDKRWDAGERLPITSIVQGKFDLKVVDQTGRICIKHGLDLTSDTTFEIRDGDLANCKH